MNILKIPLRGKATGQFAIVDNTPDNQKLLDYKWYLSNGYAARLNHEDWKNRKKRTYIHLHRIIANTPKGMFTDHINRNRLDDRVKNLRVCSHAQNNMNRTIKRKKGLRKYRGVQPTKYGTYRVFFRHKYISTHRNEEDAARAYDNIALANQGEYAVLNFSR